MASLQAALSSRPLPPSSLFARTHLFFTMVTSGRVQMSACAAHEVHACGISGRLVWCLKGCPSIRSCGGGATEVRSPWRCRRQRRSGTAAPARTGKANLGSRHPRRLRTHPKHASCPSGGCTHGAQMAAATPKVSMPFDSFPERATCCFRPASIPRSRCGMCTAAASACAHTWGTQQASGRPTSTMTGPSL